MASTNPYTSFTITQPFLGAPLQFIPALGSKELEELIDNFVTGSVSKKDKLSEVTLDFYNNAAVDLNTGALTRTYNVFTSPWSGNAFEQSPTQSMSSGFSPIYTPSPGSSATFGDSAYGSISMTPPTRNNKTARVTKKAKKDTPKAVEARLPGFQIMTKDGIDVTNSAGRGTKTKEQREHAHLMRIMKACDACKKKKIRCDPSHRRSHNDMSRASTSTSTTNTSSSGRLDPSPPASTLSLSRANTQTSQSSLPSFSPSNPIDDFILFPKDSISWNPELETQDLGQFNFDINDFDFNAEFPSMNTEQSFDFSFDPQSSNFQPDTQFGYTPNLNDQYGLDQWAEPQGYMPVAHTRPHPSGAANGSGQLDTNWQSGWLQGDALVSPRTSTFADNYWPDSLVSQPRIPPNSAVAGDQAVANELDWSLLESSISTRSSSPGDTTADSGVSEVLRSRKRRAVDEQESTSTADGSFKHLDSRNVSRNVGDIERPDPSDLHEFEAGSTISFSPSLLVQGLSPSSGGSSRNSREIARLQNSAQIVSKSLRSIGRAPAEYTALGIELQQLEGVLARLQTSQHDQLILSDSSTALIDSLSLQLLAVSSSVNPQRRRHKLNGLSPAHARELQISARRLIRSLCATISHVESKNTGTNPPTSNTQLLTSGRNLNLQLQVSSSDLRDQDGYAPTSGLGVQVDGSSMSSPAGRSSSGALSRVVPSSSVLQHAAGFSESLDIYIDLEGMVSLGGDSRDNAVTNALTVRDVPRFAMILKTSSDLSPYRVESSRSLERTELSERELLVAGADLNSSPMLSPTWTTSEREAYREALSSGQALARTNLFTEELTGGLATSQPGCAYIGVPSPSENVQRDIARRDSTPTPIPSLATARTEVEVERFDNIDTIDNVKSKIQSENRVAINLLSTVRSREVDASSNVFTSQLSVLAALAIIGELALASNVSVSRVSILAHLPYLLLILALSLIPGQQRHSTALIAGVLLFASSFTLSGISNLRSNCTEWIGNDPFSAVAKLLLVATLVSSKLLSSLNLSLIAVAAMKYLTGTQDVCSSGNGVRVPRRQVCEDRNGFASWLGMMDVLSPVVAV